jgi:tetratricopeptide (TPR) repeat protein
MLGRTTANFAKNLSHIVLIDGANAALPWDRLGHWAQDDEDWVEAERCFRKAYDLAGGEYGYCLAMVLKEQERFDETVPLLLEQAQTIQPDAISWFQLATSYDSLCCWPEAINAYERTLALDPNYAVALFDLGGAHWNNGDAAVATKIWTAAIERFPDHELSAKLQRDFSLLFSDPAAGKSGDDAR